LLWISALGSGFLLIERERLLLDDRLELYELDRERLTFFSLSFPVTDFKISFVPLGLSTLTKAEGWGDSFNFSTRDLIAFSSLVLVLSR
jgi:hypothetical protein